MIDSLHYYFPPGGGVAVYYKSINFSILVLSFMYTNYHIVAIEVCYNYQCCSGDELVNTAEYEVLRKLM